MHSCTDQLHFPDHTDPHAVMSGELPLPVPRLCRVGVLGSLRGISSLSASQSSTISPRLHSGWRSSHVFEWALKSPKMIALSEVGMISGQKSISWPLLLAGGQYTLVRLIHEHLPIRTRIEDTYVAVFVRLPILWQSRSFFT
jgi:hypothetical protein